MSTALSVAWSVAVIVLFVVGWATELQHFYRTLIEPTRGAAARADAMLDELRQLDPPDANAAEYGRLWDDIEATIEESRARIDAAAASTDAASELWDDDNSAFSLIDARAVILGVPRCTLDK